MFIDWQIGKTSRRDLFERQKTVAISAIVNESRFKAGFDASDFTFVNIGFFLFPAREFNIEVVEALAIYHSDAQLLFLGCVYEHSFHVFSILLGVATLNRQHGEAETMEFLCTQGVLKTPPHTRAVLVRGAGRSFQVVP